SERRALRSASARRHAPPPPPRSAPPGRREGRCSASPGTGSTRTSPPPTFPGTSRGSCAGSWARTAFRARSLRRLLRVRVRDLGAVPGEVEAVVGRILRVVAGLARGLGRLHQAGSGRLGLVLHDLHLPVVAAGAVARLAGDALLRLVFLG